MFSVAGDGGDTQVVDANPAISDCETDDGCGDDGGGDVEIPILYGETQALDVADFTDDAVVGGRDGGVKGCGETQLVDTCVDETSERTEVLIEEEEPSSCAETSFDADSGVRGVAQERTDGGDLLNEALKKEDCSVDSDTSTDYEEEDRGARRRSFTDIRAKAVRSSGLAASRYLACKKFDGDIRSKKDDNSEAGGIDVRSFGVNLWAENKKYPTSLDVEIGELHLEHGTENSSENHYKLGDKYNKNSNKRVRKLFDETYLEKDESGSKDGDTAKQKDMPHLFVTDNIAGLSYVTSQEPGDQSQVNALEVVDNFLLSNDVGSSQELKKGKSDIFKCAPVSSTKILGCLAEKNVRRNSIGIPSLFDWDDKLEDEGGGDFFWKRKDSLLEGTSAARKTKSHPPKTRSSISDRSITAFENSQVAKGGIKSNCNESAAIAHPDSRLVMLKSMKIGMHHISQFKAKKNLFLTMDEASNSKALETNLEMADAEVVEGAYNIGPDTQMAAEAMETLCHGSAVNSDKDTYLTPGISMQKNNGFVRKRVPSKDALHQKRSSTCDPSDAEDIITRSKRRTHASKEGKERFGLHRDLSINPRMKKSQEHINSKVKTRTEKLKLHNQLAAESSGRHVASESGKKEKGQRRIDKSSGKSVDIFLDQQNDHSSMSKELKIGSEDDDSAPVAYRTRHSKRTKLLENAESLSKEGEPDAKGLIEKEKEGNFIADAQETRRECTSASPHLDLEIRRSSSSYSGIPNSGTALEESKVSFLEDTFVNHPKRKRTTRHISSKQNLDDNGDKPAVLVGNMEKMDKHTKNGEMNKVYIRSVSDILVKARQKRRIVSTQMLLETAALLSDSKLAQTRSFQKTPFKSHSETSKCLSQSVSNQASLVEPVTLCFNGLNDDHVVEAQQLSVHKSVEEDTEHAEENAKLKGLSRREIQSPNLACVTPSKGKNALSPVCVADDLPRSFKKASATPVARELLRLEALATPRQKDVRRRKDIASVRILFSNHLDEDTVKQQKKILTRLGLAVASSISDATHFVTNKFVRTQNMLEAIAVGKPVVTPMWLESCGQASCFLDERNYILRDTKKEKELGFNMQVSLARACQCPILLGRTVYMTPNVKPCRKVLSSIAKAASGQAIARIGRSMSKQAGVPVDLLIISCLEDYSLCIPLLEKGAQIFSSELLLNGIVIQKLEYGRHQLFLDHVKRTRSTIWLRDKDDQFLPVDRCK